MRKLALGLLFLIASTLAPAPARAEGKVVQEADQVKFKKKTVIDFNDVQIEGDLTKPEGSYGMAINKAKFKSLIRLRTDFNPELQKSADHL